MIRSTDGPSRSKIWSIGNLFFAMSWTFVTRYCVVVVVLPSLDRIAIRSPPWSRRSPTSGPAPYCLLSRCPPSTTAPWASPGAGPKRYQPMTDGSGGSCICPSGATPTGFTATSTPAAGTTSRVGDGWSGVLVGTPAGRALTPVAGAGGGVGLGVLCGAGVVWLVSAALPQAGTRKRANAVAARATARRDLVTTGRAPGLPPYPCPR